VSPGVGLESAPFWRASFTAGAGIEERLGERRPRRSRLERPNADCRLPPRKRSWTTHVRSSRKRSLVVVGVA